MRLSSHHAAVRGGTAWSNRRFVRSLQNQDLDPLRHCRLDRIGKRRRRAIDIRADNGRRLLNMHGKFFGG